MSGNATLALTREEHTELLAYLAIRRKLSCADKENKLRLFVTTGGLPSRNVHC